MSLGRAPASDFGRVRACGLAAAEGSRAIGVASEVKPQRTGHVSVETLARVLVALYRAHPLHSGSGTASDVSRHEPLIPKPDEAGRVSSPEGQSDGAPPGALKAATDPDRSGSREAVVPAGGERNIRGRSLPVNALPARAYRRGRTGAGGQHREVTGNRVHRSTMRRQDDLPKLAVRIASQLDTHLLARNE